MIRVERRSVVSGKVHTMDLDITEEQWLRYINGELVQDAFPNLSPDEREFIISGTTKEEWEALFGDGED